MELLGEPQFYDTFGLPIFLFITIISVWGLSKKKPLPKWVLVALLIIGVMGLVVDGTIVYNFYL